MSRLNEVNPPAIVKPAESVAGMVMEVKSLCGTIAQSEKANLSRAIAAGKILIQIRATCPRGDWKDTLIEVGITKQRASEYMRLAKGPAPDLSKCLSIREALGKLEEMDNETAASNHAPADLEEESKASVEIPPTSPSRSDQPTPEVAPEPAGPKIPERLQPFFADIALFDKGISLAHAASRVFADLEQTAAAKKAVEGKKHRAYSSDFSAAERFAKAVKPFQPCAACGGEYEPSPDSDLCTGCSGKGYQTAEDLEE